MTTAVDRLLSTLSNPAAVEAVWTNPVRIRLGEPDPARLANLEGKGLPASYLELLGRCNGIAIAANQDKTSNVKTVPASELGEPDIWPAESYGEHFALPPVDGIAQPFIFGGLDTNYFVLDLEAGAVAWVDEDGAVTQLAPSFDAFLDEFAAAGGCVPVVLRAHAVPGYAS